MRSLTVGALLTLTALAAPACGGSGAPSSGSGGEGATSSGTGGDHASGSGTGTGSSSASSGGGGSSDCNVGADCPSGSCVEVVPGGFHVCQTVPVEQTMCSGVDDECCESSECPGGAACILGPLVPMCGGPRQIAHNQCAIDQCEKDGDCSAQQFCCPAGTLDRQVRACVFAACQHDFDCRQEAGGICAPVKEPCCNNTAGLFCVYPNGGCRESGECGPDQYCAILGNEAACVQGSPQCPN